MMQSMLATASQQSGVVSATNWDSFVATHAAGHILQTSAWSQLKSRFGWREGGAALVDQGGNVHAGALLLFRRVAGLTLAYAPKGPLTNWQDHQLTTALLAELVNECRRFNAVTLKLEPGLPDTMANRALLHSYGLRPSPQTVQPRSTILLDLSGSEDAMIQRMKSKWRYNVRLAARKEVTVREAHCTDLPAINRLMQVTGERDGFAVHSTDYYKAAFELFVPRWGVFLLAEYKQQPLAAIVVCQVGDTAWYLWGASSDRERNRMPNHALQWAAMQWARRRGATRYDLWGIPDEIGKVAQGLRNGDGSGTPADELPLDVEALPANDLWGVYRFKQGFGGNVVRYIGAWDLPIHPLGHRLYVMGLAARDKFETTLQRRGERTQPSLPSPARQRAITQSPNDQITQSFSLRAIHSPSEWRTILASLPDPHVLQSWEWGQIKAQTGWIAERLVIGNREKSVAAFQFLWRQPVPGLPIRVAYVPKGPALDWHNFTLVDEVLGWIESYAWANKCLFVKIDPDVREDAPAGRLVLHALERRGWRFSSEQIQFKNTAYSDLALGEEKSLEAMKSKWRYNIRLAERRGIQVRQGTVADLDRFYALYAETGKRDGFLIRPYSYYRTTWETFLNAQADPGNPAGGALLIAEHPEEQQPLAGLFLMRYGQRAWYFYGASSERRRRDMPNYLLQWEAMRWSMAQGCTRYDWWGAPTDVENAEDDLQGVWQFKQGFGAQFQPHVGAWDFPVSPWLYRLYQEALPQVMDWLRTASALRQKAE